MKKIIIGLLFIFSIPALGQSNAANHVLKLTTEYSEAIARRDASVHKRLFAPDYTYTNGGGNSMGREDHMNLQSLSNMLELILIVIICIMQQVNHTKALNLPINGSGFVPMGSRNSCKAFKLLNLKALLLQ